MNTQTDHKSRQNQGSQPRTAVSPDRSATSENLQLDATGSIRDSHNHLGPDRGGSDPRRSDMSEPRYRFLLRVRTLAGADCEHDAQTSTAQSSPRCAYLPHRWSGGHFRPSMTFLPTHQRKKANELKLLASPFSRHRWYTLGLFKTFQGCCQFGRRALQMDCPEVQPYFGSRLDLLGVAHMIDIYPFVSGFIQTPKRLGLLVFLKISDT